MRAKVIHNACSATGFLLPRIGLDVIPETIIMRNELNYFSNTLLFDNFFYSKKITIPTSVLKYSKYTIILFCKCNQLICFRYINGKWLFYHYMFSSLQC